MTSGLEKERAYT